jgi:16S rRNA (guanine527-N7)-methyltransferase
MSTPHWRIDELFPDLGLETRAQLRELHTELLKFNKAINLISANSIVDADLIHIADGIIGSKIVIGNLSTKTIYDIGSGNGIPGIVAAVLSPAHNFILLDSDGRKVEFMKHCISKLKLDNCSVVLSRIEEIDGNQINAAVSRGFSSIQNSISLISRGAAETCEYFHFKSAAVEGEISACRSEQPDWEVSLLAEYEIPKHPGKRSIVLTKRT